MKAIIKIANHEDPENDFISIGSVAESKKLTKNNFLLNQEITVGRFRLLVKNIEIEGFYNTGNEESVTGELHEYNCVIWLHCEPLGFDFHEISQDQDDVKNYFAP